MAVAELEQNKNDSTGTSSGNVDGIKSVNSYINFDNISGKVSSTEGTYDRYKELEDFSFTMPGGWGSRDIEIFLKSCWTNLDHLRTLSNDENKKWGEIASFITEKSNGHVFTINSCMEVAMCIKEYINEKKDVLMSDNSFRQFYNEVLDLLPYFPEPRYVSQAAQMNANTSWYNAIDENYTHDKNSQLKETLIELIITNYNEIKEGNQSIWGEISTVVSKRTGLNIDVKALVKHVKRTAQLEVPQEKDPLDKKELFISFMKKIVNGHDFLRYSVFHNKNNLSPVNIPLIISDYEDTKLKRRYSADQLSYRKSKIILEDGKILRECDPGNVGRRTLQKRRGRKPRNLGARKLETDSYKKFDEDLFNNGELPNTSFVNEQDCLNVLETNNENNLTLKKEIMLETIKTTNEIKLTEHCTIAQSESSSLLKEVPTDTKKKDNMKKKQSTHNLFFVEGTQNESSIVTAFQNEKNHSLSTTKSDISKVGVKKLDKKTEQSRARTSVKPYETIHKKGTFVGRNECKVLVEKCEPFISEVSRKRFHDNEMDDTRLTNSNENDLPVKQIKLTHEEDDMLHTSQFIKSSLSESNLFGLHKEDPRIKVLPRRCRRKLNPPTRILPMRKCAVKENELLFHYKIGNDSGFSGLQYQNKANNDLPVSEVNLDQLPAGKSQITLSEPITERNQLEFDHSQSTGDHSYSICIEGRRSKSAETFRDTCSLYAEGHKSRTTYVKGKYKKNTTNSKKTGLFVIDTTDELVNSEPEQLGSKREETDSDYLGFMSHDERTIVRRKTRRNKKISHVSYLPFYKDTNKKDYILSSCIDKNVNKSIVTNPRADIKSEDISPLDLSQKSLQYSSGVPQEIRSLNCQILINKLPEALKEILNSQETIENTVKENGDCPGCNEIEKTDMINTEQKDLVNYPQIKCKTKLMSKTKHDRTTACSISNEEMLTNKVQRKRGKRKHSFSSIQPLSKNQNEIVILTECNENVFSKISCGVSKSDNAIVGLDNYGVPQDISHNKGNTKASSTIALGNHSDFNNLPKGITKFDSIKQKNEFITKNNSLLVEIEGNSDNIKTSCLPKQADRYTQSNSVRVGKHNNDKKIRCLSSKTLTGGKSNKASISSICESNVVIDYAPNKIESDSHFSDQEMFPKSSEEDECTVEHSSSPLCKNIIQLFKYPSNPPTASINVCDPFESLNMAKIDSIMPSNVTLKLAKGCKERFTKLKTTGNELFGSGDPLTEIIRVMEPNLFESASEINKVITLSNLNESNCPYLMGSYPKLINTSVSSSLLTSNSALDHSELAIENDASITAIGHQKNMIRFPTLVNVADMSQTKTGCIFQNNAQVLPFGNQFYKNLLSIPSIKMEMSIVTDVLNTFNNRIRTNEQIRIETIPYLLLSGNESCFTSKKIYLNKHRIEVDHCYSIDIPFSPREENMRFCLSLKDELLADKKTAMGLPYNLSSKELTKSRNMCMSTLTKIINALSNHTGRIEYYQVGEINNLSEGTSKIIQKEPIPNPCQKINQVIKIEFNNNISNKFFTDKSGNKANELISKFADRTSNKNNYLNEYSLSMPILCSGNTYSRINQYETNSHSLVCKISLDKEVTNEVILKFPNILLSEQAFNSTGVIKPLYSNKYAYGDSSHILENNYLNRLTHADELNSIGTVYKVTDIAQTTSLPCKLIRNIALRGKQSTGKIMNSQKIFKLNKGLNAHKYLPLRCRSCKGLALNASCRGISPSLPTEILCDCISTMIKRNDQISVAKSSCTPDASEIHFNRDITCTTQHFSLNKSSSCVCHANILAKTARVLNPKQTHIEGQYPPCISNLKAHTSEKVDGIDINRHNLQQNDFSLKSLHEDNGLLHFTNPGTLLNCYADTSHTSDKVRGRKRKLSRSETKFRTDTTNKKWLANQITSTPITLPLKEISKSSVKTSTGLILNAEQPSPIDTELSIFEQQKGLVYCPKRKLPTPSNASSIEKITGRILSSHVQLNLDGDGLFSTSRERLTRKAKTNILYNSSTKRVKKKQKQHLQNSENVHGHNFSGDNNFKARYSKTVDLKTRDKNSDSESYSTISNKSLIFNRTSFVKLKQQKYNENCSKKSTKFPLVKLNDIMRIKFVSSSIMNKGSVNIVEFEGRVMDCKSSHSTSQPVTFGNSKVIPESKLSTASSNMDVFVNNKTSAKFNLSSSTNKVNSPKNSLHHSMNETESLQTNEECLSTANYLDKSIVSEKSISELVNSSSVIMFNNKPDVLGKLIAVQENTSNKVTYNSQKETTSSTCRNVDASYMVTRYKKDRQFRRNQKDSSSSSNAQKLISRTPRSSLTVKNGQEEIPCNLERFNNTLQKGVYLNRNKNEVDSSSNNNKSNLTSSQNVFVKSQLSSVTREDNQGETLNYSKNYSEEKSINYLSSNSVAFGDPNSSANASCLTIRAYQNRRPSQEIEPTTCIQSTHPFSASSNRYHSDLDFSRKRRVENHNKQINLSLTYLKENISCIRGGGPLVRKEHLGAYKSWLNRQKQRLAKLEKIVNKVNKSI